MHRFKYKVINCFKMYSLHKHTSKLGSKCGKFNITNMHFLRDYVIYLYVYQITNTFYKNKTTINRIWK